MLAGYQSRPGKPCKEFEDGVRSILKFENDYKQNEKVASFARMKKEDVAISMNKKKLLRCTQNDVNNT